MSFHLTRSRIVTFLQVVVITVIGFLIYSNTFSASFQFDDKLNITENQRIRDIGNFWPPGGNRWFGLLTFACNYKLSGLNPFGYHLTNTCIHILTALAFYLLILLTFKTPSFESCRGSVESRTSFAFVCALLFVAHPIQTQAVTYIVQRFASLTALLYITTLNLYILARLTPSDKALKRLLYFTLAVLPAFAGFMTKENSFTLPVIILLYDALFICGISRVITVVKGRWRLMAFVTGVISTGFVLAFNYSDSVYSFIDGLRATREISRHDYLITQFRVIVTYLRLLFFPVNQTIDHHYPVYSNLISTQIIASLALIIFMFSLAIYAGFAARKQKPLLGLVSFGIIWFFVTLSIESSIIPIIDVMFEHRLYLPSIGIIIAVIAALFHMLQRSVVSRKTCIVLVIITVTLLSYATYSRNKVWNNEVTLWSDAVVKKPKNPRGYNMLGNYYLANFKIYDAIYFFQKSLETDSFYHAARSNLGRAYIMTGRVDEGLRELLITERSHRFDKIDTGVLYYNIGHGYYIKGLPDQALSNLSIALRHIPNHPGLHYLLGKVYMSKNLITQSEISFKRAHELEPKRY